MNAAQTQTDGDVPSKSPSDGPKTVQLKAPDGFKPSTAIENAKAVPPVRPPRVAYPFDEI
ncbi:hypothetical protein PQR65_05285 [Paraburkholderia nemoris]|uniref:hypothetical protein n=1 Tax=Paraburkholderia nemoris TaxID=2793076 RepID=UPI0038BA9841